MKNYQVLIYQEAWYTAFIPGGGKVDPQKLGGFLNTHAADGWKVVTMEREIRRSLFFFSREAFIIIMEK